MQVTISTEIPNFINHCKFEKNLSNKTIKAYTIDLNQFVTFLKKNEYSISMDKITKAEIRNYLESISNLKPKSIKRKIATIKAIFNYLEFEDSIQVNPLRKMKIKIKESRRLPKAMNLNEVNQILKKAYQRLRSFSHKEVYTFYEAIRNAVVIELLFTTGARVSEIANLRIENFQLNTGEIRIRGKGDKERVIQICNPESLDLIRKYYLSSKEKIDKSGGYFLINRFGNQLSDQSIRGIVKKISLDTKITKRITPHMFRHTMATLLLENDVDIRYIQSILGHSSINTTQIYTQVNPQKQRRILKSKHPRNNITHNLFLSE